MLMDGKIDYHGNVQNGVYVGLEYTRNSQNFTIYRPNFERAGKRVKEGTWPKIII